MSNNDSVFIDGLIYLSDGNPRILKDGNVTAANVTVAPMQAELEAAFDNMAAWLKHLQSPDSGWHLVRSATDITKARDEGRVALIMGWQNARPLSLNVDRVTAFHALGLRVLQLTYNEANYVGDGCVEERDGPLSRFGRELVAEMNRVGVAIDVSHCCDATAFDTAKVSDKPIFATHANAKSVNDLPRNKSDRTLRAIADTGGVVGLSVHAYMNWDNDPKRPPSLHNFAKHVRYVADIAGTEHVGIGTDFAAVADERLMDDIFSLGKNRYPEVSGPLVKAFGNDLSARFPKETQSPADFPKILEVLEDAGFNDTEVNAIAGGNFLRSFGDAWT